MCVNVWVYMQLTNALVVQSFQAGQAIVTEGEKGDVLYILKSGKAKVSIKNKEIRILEVRACRLLYAYSRIHICIYMYLYTSVHVYSYI